MNKGTLVQVREFAAMSPADKSAVERHGHLWLVDDAPQGMDLDELIWCRSLADNAFILGISTSLTMDRKGALVWIEFNEETMTENDRQKLKKHGPLWLVRDSSVAGDRLLCESMKDRGATHVWYDSEVKFQ